MIKDLLRSICPYGIVSAHKRRFVLHSLGLPDGADIAAAVSGCRFDLWPPFLRENPSGWTLVDVGANEGDFIAAVLRISSPHRVFAFEPQPSCQASLHRILAGHANAHVVQAAVGSEKGEVEFNCTLDSKLSSVLQPEADVAPHYGNGKFGIVQTLKVPSLRLDDAIAGEFPVDLLKIDVQGFELEVFKGAEQVLRRTRAVLLEVNYVEHYKNGARFDDVYSILRSKGFHLYGISAPQGGVAGGPPLWADAMFVKE
jgi:FkbM family methyltransferase